MLPHVQVATLADLDWPALYQTIGPHAAVILDKDNTLTVPYQSTIHPTVQSSVDEAVRIFGKHRVAILSNSAGTATDDADDAQAAAVEAATGLSVIRHADKKPSRACLNQVLEHLHNNSNGDGGSSIGRPLEASDLIVVGDRLWTDVVFGNLYGCLTVHVTQTLDSDNPKANHWTARRLRPLEQRIGRWCVRRGFQPPPRAAHKK
jgi:phosphatidylglycerophosphatase GEP4